MTNNSTGTVDLEISARGYFTTSGATTPGDTYRSVTTATALDTSLTGNASQTFAVTGAGLGVPAGADAVAVQVLAKNAGARGNLILKNPDDPTGVAVIRYNPGEKIETLDLPKLSSAGKLTITNGTSTSVDTVIRVRGYYLDPSATEAGSTFVPVTAAEIFDTTNTGVALKPSGQSGDAVTVQVTGEGATGDKIPTGGVAQVALNIAANTPTASGYLTMYRADASDPAGNSPILFFEGGDNQVNNEDQSNLGTTGTSGSGKVKITNHSSGTVHVRLAVRGYYKEPTRPGAPTAVTATAGAGNGAVVNWTRPNADGGAAITGYVVTASPGGQTATTGAASRSASVPGLTAGQTYSFTVTAKNNDLDGASGNGTPSTASNPVQVGTLAEYHVTRSSIGTTDAHSDVDNNGQTTAHSYAYNTLDQLTGDNSTLYGYDPAGNPTTIAGTTQAFDAASELLASGSTTFGYSASGNRISATPLSGSATVYGYNGANQLTNWVQGATNYSYTYDGNGLRSSTITGGTTTWFTYDQSSVPLLLSDGTNSYIYGPDGTALEQITQSGTATYLHPDHRGNTRLVSSGSGVVTGKYTYDPYGKVVTHTGTDTALQFGQGYTDPTGLVYLRARHYDPATGLFLSRDPIEHVTGQPYQYAAGNPIDSADPMGLCNKNPLSSGFWTDGNCISDGAEYVGGKARDIADSDFAQSAKSMAGSASTVVSGVAAGCYTAMLYFPVAEAGCVAVDGVSNGLDWVATSIACVDRVSSGYECLTGVAGSSLPFVSASMVRSGLSMAGLQYCEVAFKALYNAVEWAVDSVRQGMPSLPSL